MQFPTVSSRNLENESFTLPRDFEGKYNIVCLAFIEAHQYLVDTWTPFLRELRDLHPSLQIYELPVVGQMPWYQRKLLDYWMRTGIPDPTVRATTITLYVNREQFIRQIGLTNIDTIYTLLVDQVGTVHWHTDGRYTPEKGAALAAAVRILVSTIA